MNWFRGNGFLLAGTRFAGTLLAISALAGTFFFAGTQTANALVVYGETNAEAQVDYTAGTDYLYSTVSVAGGDTGSATYLGGGWFLTANHVSTSVGTTIYQNGYSTTIDYIDNTLLSTYGVDLKLVYCASAEEDLVSLKMANLPDSSIFSQLKSSSVATSTSRFPPGGTTYTPVAGTTITLVGFGRGRSNAYDTEENSTATSVTALGNYAARTGTAECCWSDEDSGIFATWAEQETGSAQGCSGDSGGSAFICVDGTYYLIGVMRAVGNTGGGGTNDVYFGDQWGELTLTDQTLSLSGSHSDEFSLTYMVYLESYISTISEIIKTSPLSIAIPEPSFFSIFAGTLALLLAGTRRRRARERSRRRSF